MRHPHVFAPFDKPAILSCFSLNPAIFLYHLVNSVIILYPVVENSRFAISFCRQFSSQVLQELQSHQYSKCNTRHCLLRPLFDHSNSARTNKRKRNLSKALSGYTAPLDN